MFGFCSYNLLLSCCYFQLENKLLSICMGTFDRGNDINAKVDVFVSRYKHALLAYLPFFIKQIMLCKILALINSRIDSVGPSISHGQPCLENKTVNCKFIRSPRSC